MQKLLTYLTTKYGTGSVGMALDQVTTLAQRGVIHPTPWAVDLVQELIAGIHMLEAVPGTLTVADVLTDPRVLTGDVGFTVTGHEGTFSVMEDGETIICGDGWSAPRLPLTPRTLQLAATLVVGKASGT